MLHWATFYHLPKEASPSLSVTTIRSHSSRQRCEHQPQAQHELVRYCNLDSYRKVVQLSSLLFEIRLCRKTYLWYNSFVSSQSDTKSHTMTQTLSRGFGFAAHKYQSGTFGCSLQCLSQECMCEQMYVHTYKCTHTLLYPVPADPGDL